MKSKLRGAWLIVVLVAGIAFASVDFVKLVWTPQKGASAKFAVQDLFETQFAKISYKYTSVETVEDIADGRVVVKMERSEPKINADGPTGCPISIARFAKVTYALNGQYLDTEMARHSPFSARFGNSTAVVLPSKPISDGDQWTHNVQSNPKTNTRAGKGSYKFLGVEQIGKWKTYKVSFSYQETEGEDWERMSASGTKWISTEDGSVIQEQFKMEGLASCGLESITSESKRIE